jgi:hypothetical protein
MTTDEIERINAMWSELIGVLDYQRGQWYEFVEGSQTRRNGWHEIDENRARRIMRDLGYDPNEDQRANREVESLRPLTIMQLFRIRDGETHRRPHGGKTREQQEKDERAEDSRARLIADAQTRLFERRACD